MILFKRHLYKKRNTTTFLVQALLHLDKVQNNLEIRYLRSRKAIKFFAFFLRNQYHRATEHNYSHRARNHLYGTIIYLLYSLYGTMKFNSVVTIKDYENMN